MPLSWIVPLRLLPVSGARLSDLKREACMWSCSTVYEEPASMIVLRARRHVPTLHNGRISYSSSPDELLLAYDVP